MKPTHTILDTRLLASMDLEGMRGHNHHGGIQPRCREHHVCSNRAAT